MSGASGLIKAEFPNWQPLLARIGSLGCTNFMWMYHKDGLEYYKHIDTRRYLIPDGVGPLLSTTRCHACPGRVSRRVCVCEWWSWPVSKDSLYLISTSAGLCTLAAGARGGDSKPARGDLVSGWRGPIVGAGFPARSGSSGCSRCRVRVDLASLPRRLAGFEERRWQTKKATPPAAFGNGLARYPRAECTSSGVERITKR